MNPTPRDPKERQQALTLADQGVPTVEVARRLGIPPSTVRRWIAQRANQIEAKQSFLDLRGRTSSEVQSPALKLALSGVWG